MRTEALSPGEELGEYTIQGPLGKGGMAEVYQATHLVLERTVAIKVLNPGLNVDPTFPLRFLREAKTVARLSHPNIITIYDFKDKGDRAYLVMELASNGTLRDRAKQFRTLSEATEGLAPVCEALQFAHQRGVVHRDVKSNNVLINEHGQPLLADFGLARVVEESLDFTLLGTSAGSPHYMAPEQAMGEDVDHRADIYALGVVAYEVIAGRLPYSGKTAVAVMQQHVSGDLPSIRALIPEAPARLEAAIQRAMAKRPDDRFDSAGAFLAELRAAATEAPDLPVRAGRAPTATVAAASAPASNGPSLRAAPSKPSQEEVSDATLVGTDDDDLLDATVVDFEPISRESFTAAAAPGLAAEAETPLETPLDQDADALAPLPPRAKPSRARPSAFNSLEWVALAVVVLILVGIVGLSAWFALARPVADSSLAAAANALFTRLPLVRNVMALLTVLLGLLNTTFMRVAVLGDYHISARTYQRLRNYHRFVGYTTGSIAIAVQVLTWIEIGAIGMPAGRAVANLLVGTALLLLFVTKVAVVRYIQRLRLYLPWFGIGLAVLATAVLLINALPIPWTA